MTSEERRSGAATVDGPVVLTVVVIVFNDADRLPTAVGSAMRQTLRGVEVVIVDDASTDGTPAVAARLAAAHPGRVRVERLEQNSGGCSRPRNAGIALARGRYVMFLDSDDELPPNAGRALVEAAEASGADFAAGLCVRVHLNRGRRVTGWYPWLYNQRVVYSSVLDNPDLLYDTLSTNKCYRRSFLDEQDLRFPDGYHYEDLLFSAKAYMAARRIAIVPDVVYRWNVVERTDTPSITNRRSELRNFEDRVRIHRLIDAEFAAHDATELKLAKDVKFLKHDLRLYLNDLPYRDAEFRRAFLAHAKDYLATLDPRAFDRAEPVQAIAGWMVLHDDEPNLFTAIDYIAHGRKLSTRLVEDDGRVYWCADHLDDPTARSVLDVTDLRLHELPLSRLDLYNRLTALDVDGTRLRLAGSIVNQLGRIPRDAPLRLELVVAARRRMARRRAVVVDDLRHDGDQVAWSAEVDLERLVRAVGFLDRVWDVRAQLTVDDEVNLSRLSTREPAWDGLVLPVRPMLGRLAADRLETLVTPDGDLALEFIPETRVARAVHTRGQRLLEAPATRRARYLARRVVTAARHPNDPRVRHAVFKRTLARLPARAHIVFESEAGARCTGNPRAIYDEIRARDLPFDAVWAHAGRTEEFPPGVRLVRRGSLAYYAALARAAAWVDDGRFPVDAVKRPGTVYLNAASGTPVRRAGFDAEPMRRATAGERWLLRKQIDRWDAVVVRAPFDADVMAGSYRARARMLRLGYPRNDALVTGGDPVAVKELRARLGVDAGACVVLHVPSCPDAVLTPDASVLAAGQVLVVRPGAAVASSPAAPGAGAVDASRVDDLTTLLLAADVLVTDHDPVLFDLPLRRRPVVLVGCRCGVRGSRGVDADAYLDLDADGPGPVVWDAGALREALADLDRLVQRHAADLERVVSVYGAYDTGQAASRVVDALLERLSAAVPQRRARDGKESE